jgi:hypothetical protein
MESTLNAWRVRIEGWQTDLEHLARYCSSLPRRIFEDGKERAFFYESDSFAALATSEDVLAVANQELAVLSGVLALVRGSSVRLTASSAYRRNEKGGEDIFLHIQETVSLRVEEGDVSVTLTDAQGNVVTSSAEVPSRTAVIAALGMSDEAVGKALRLFAATDFRTWTGLYRLLEVIIGDVGGEAKLTAQQWGAAGDLKRFKHSANSVTVGGDTSRHGAEGTTPPSRPMSLEEATAYVQYVFTAWLASKSS